MSLCFYCSVAGSCQILWDPVDCSTLGFLVLRCLTELAQIRVHWVDDAIQSSHPLLPPCPPAFNLSQHQGLFQWGSFAPLTVSDSKNGCFYSQSEEVWCESPVKFLFMFWKTLCGRLVLIFLKKIPVSRWRYWGSSTLPLLCGPIVSWQGQHSRFWLLSFWSPILACEMAFLVPLNFYFTSFSNG